ncbi:chloride channel protein, CIC family [Methylomagnum ishizawai]|uniref:Chloride channel protein, CIC family n=1 Tax=Methylomagnum ishizawai TaxID=1760988 RepID=A0A1Y6D337_9GAMM|nr:H(+)/Cl(-) exchange transporter ClcA [Methylomagnum ishizawai]SMF97359.1 chloride channel protein, CIC family [Methylomagnum ishizawai]
MKARDELTLKRGPAHSEERRAIPRELLREHARFSLLNRERRRLLPWAILLGVLSGLLAVGFHFSLDVVETLRNRLIGWSRGFGGWGIGVPMAVSGTGVFIAAWLVRRFAPEASGSGIPHLKAVLQGYRAFSWGRTVIVKFTSGVIGIGVGMALGREGPTVQMGGALGWMLGNHYSKDPDKLRILVAAGGGAGLSAAFNAPLSGMVFVLEELQGRFASLEFFAAAVACLTADMVCRAFLGDYPVFRLPPVSTPALELLPAFVPLGAACGVLGVVFNRCVLAAQRVSARTAGWYQAWWVIWGMALGLCGWLAPEVLGGGQSFAGRVIDGHPLAAASILYYFLARFALTIGSYGTGTAGGIFAPILVLGALVGLEMGQWAIQLFPGGRIEPYVFAVAGMASFFTGSVRALLTGVVLMIEMTGNYALILPLLVACFTAWMVADWLHDTPIYEALFQRDLAKGVGRGTEISDPDHT